ncbi:MAG: hypothetical protein M1817_006254 [Caeruleum heppii]|nr:MAG: hypothetical protein M1817_006254 [Caeruleum heppii]
MLFSSLAGSIVAAALVSSALASPADLLRRYAFGEGEVQRRQIASVSTTGTTGACAISDSFYAAKQNASNVGVLYGVTGSGPDYQAGIIAFINGDRTASLLYNVTNVASREELQVLVRPAGNLTYTNDGGGIRGVSELIILQQLMLDIKRSQGLADPPKPSDVFDLIGGTSTGGLIALLLGRLRLSVQEAVDEYTELSKQVFSERKPKHKDGMFKATLLEELIQDVVKRKGFPKNASGVADPDLKLIEPDGEGNGCKVFVCTKNAANLDFPRLFRSYNVDEVGQYDNMTIWQAGRATTAAPTFFKRLKIGPANMQEEFVDGGMGSNNPAKEVLLEAENVFGLQRNVDCLVSIGTGKTNVIGFEAPRHALQAMLPRELINALASMATAADEVDRELASRYRSFPGLYHRFNVEHGLQNISLEEWDQLANVKAQTISYLQEPDTKIKLHSAVARLRGDVHHAGSNSIALSDLAGNQLGRRLEQQRFNNIPRRLVARFVGREDDLSRITEALEASESASLGTHVVVLVGMGGQGKTQIALEYCNRVKKSARYTLLLWAEADTLNTLTRSFASIAKLLFGGLEPNLSDSETVRRVVEALKDAAFLLIIDNLDDPRVISNLRDFIPESKFGSIVITSRYRGEWRVGTAIDVGEMKDKEAVCLLLPAAEKPLVQNQEPYQEAVKIIRLLGNLALAIDIAGSYIRRSRLPLSSFKDRFEQRKRLLEDIPPFWEYEKRVNDGDEEAKRAVGVFASFELSLDLLKDETVHRVSKISLLTLFAFLNAADISQAFLSAYFKCWGCDFGCKDESNMRKFASKMLTDCVTWIFEFLDDNGKLDSAKFNEFVAEASSISLLTGFGHDERGVNVSLHSLVSEWLRIRMAADQERHFLIQSLLVSARHHSEWTGNLRPGCRNPIWVGRPKPLGLDQETIEHLHVCVRNTEGRYLELFRASSAIPILYFELGEICMNHDLYQDAESLLTTLRDNGTAFMISTGMIQATLSFHYAQSGCREKAKKEIQGYLQHSGIENNEGWDTLLQSLLVLNEIAEAEDLVVNLLRRAKRAPTTHLMVKIIQQLIILQEFSIISGNARLHAFVSRFLGRVLQWRTATATAESSISYSICYVVAVSSLVAKQVNLAITLFAAVVHNFEKFQNDTLSQVCIGRSLTFLIGLHSCGIMPDWIPRNPARLPGLVCKRVNAPWMWILFDRALPGLLYANVWSRQLSLAERSTFFLNVVHRALPTVYVPPPERKPTMENAGSILEEVNWGLVDVNEAALFVGRVVDFHERTSLQDDEEFRKLKSSYTQLLAARENLQRPDYRYSLDDSSIYPDFMTASIIWHIRKYLEDPVWFEMFGDFIQTGGRHRNMTVGLLDLLLNYNPRSSLDRSMGG